MPPWLVVGLGNPGPTYAAHRHNVGYHVVEELASRLGTRFGAAKGIRAEVAEGRLGGPGVDAPRLALVKSRTYMNETGGPVSQLLAYYKLDPTRLIVIHDELDIEPGQLRVKFGGGDNGHNGLKSIRKSLGGGDYYRVRVGVGRPTPTRTRWKSPVPSEARSDRSPLWPLSPPPSLVRSAPNGMSSSSWTAMIRSVGTL